MKKRGAPERVLRVLSLNCEVHSGPAPNYDWPLSLAPRPRHQGPGEGSGVAPPQPRAHGVRCHVVTRCHDQDAGLDTDGICLGSGSVVGGQHCHGPGVCTRHSLRQNYRHSGIVL